MVWCLAFHDGETEVKSLWHVAYDAHSQGDCTWSGRLYPVYRDVFSPIWCTWWHIASPIHMVFLKRLSEQVIPSFKWIQRALTCEPVHSSVCQCDCSIWYREGYRYMHYCKYFTVTCHGEERPTSLSYCCHGISNSGLSTQRDPEQNQAWQSGDECMKCSGSWRQDMITNAQKENTVRAENTSL